jgi:serine acetyltransferase
MMPRSGRKPQCREYALQDLLISALLKALQILDDGLARGVSNVTPVPVQVPCRCDAGSDTECYEHCSYMEIAISSFAAMLGRSNVAHLASPRIGFNAGHHAHVMDRSSAQLSVDRVDLPGPLEKQGSAAMAADDSASANVHGTATVSVLNLDRLVAELRSARRAARQAGTQPVRTRDLPSPASVESLVQRLHSTLFPRHRGAHDDVEAGVDYFVGYNLNEALRELAEQIRRELRFTVLGAPILARIIAELAHSATGIDIHPGAQIAGNFFIDHGTGVVIGETAIIGERVRLYQAVTLGAKRLPADSSGALIKGKPRHPVVEDDVVIYAGATVLGRVTVGSGSVIGGNVWLTRSVPPNSRIVQAQADKEVFENGAGI